MKRRARRAMILTAALVAVLLAVLGVANWSTVRDHVEAWLVQLTKETATIQPDPALRIEIDTPNAFLHALAKYWGCPVVFELGPPEWPLLAIEPNHFGHPGRRHSSSGIWLPRPQTALPAKGLRRDPRQHSIWPTVRRAATVYGRLNHDRTEGGSRNAAEPVQVTLAGGVAVSHPACIP